MKKLRMKSIFVFALLLALIPVSVGFFDTSLDVRSRAFGPKAPEVQTSLSLLGPKSGLAKLVALVEEVKTTPLSETFQLVRSDTGISVSYDPNVWQPLNEPKNGDSLTLTTKRAFGSGAVSIAKVSTDESLGDPKKLDLKIGPYTATKVTRSERVLGKDAVYDVYFVHADNAIYKVTSRHDEFQGTEELIHGLLEHMSISTGTKTAVQGVSKKSESEMTKLEAAQIAELVKPSVVKILEVSCHKLNIVTNGAPVKYMQSTYPFCTGGEGSGLVVGETGYIATNGHVVKTYPEYALIDNLFRPALHAFLVDFIREITYENSRQEVSADLVESELQTILSNPTTAQVIIEATYTLMDKKALTIIDDQSKIWVKLGSSPFEFDVEKVKNGQLIDAVKPGNAIMNAKLVDTDFANYYSPDVVLRKQKPTGSDVAILQITGAGEMKFPSLKLGDVSALHEGDKLVVVGYPGLVEGNDGLIDYESSSAKATVTQGIVSAIKKDEGGKTIIQTDASVDHGNSGGPAMNAQGEVVGIVTYGFTSGSGNYNFLRDIKDLKDLLQKNSIDLTHQNVYGEWETGLGNYWNDYYTKSLKYIAQVKKSYPIHPTADEYITSAKEAIKEGKDKGLLFGIEKSLAIGLLSSGGSLSVIALIAGGFVLMKRQERMKAAFLGQSPVVGQQVADVLISYPPSVQTPQVAYQPQVVVQPVVQPVVKPVVQASVQPVAPIAAETVAKPITSVIGLGDPSEPLEPVMPVVQPVIQEPQPQVITPQQSMAVPVVPEPLSPQPNSPEPIVPSGP